MAAYLKVPAPDGVLHRAIDDTRIAEGVFDGVVAAIAARAD
jgi:hypothetical protein